MNESPLENKDNSRQENPFLKNGEQTTITESIRKKVEGIKGTTKERVQQIFKILGELEYKKENKDSIFRKRTADQILHSGFVTGCTDVTLAFIALARALNMPTKYIEAIKTEYIEKPNLNDGHVYAGVLEGSGRWIITDPTFSRFDIEPENYGYTIVAEGLDSWDIGIRDFDSLKEKFDDFRRSHKPTL
ncbi:MAG: transglutaminase domain-containing protein [Nitrosarchaeum sp.]|nr:transglutaminase domain-containing protein [Nitrosarchaeum sp.]